jgi:hypothetical protein
MNIINDDLDLEILKVLLACPMDSIYKVKKELEKKQVKIEGKKINLSTTRRRLLNLEKQGFILTKKGVRTTKNGQLDKREPQNESLTFKGLFKLIIDTQLTDSELRLVISKTQDSILKSRTQLTELSLVREIPVNALRDSFRQMRSRINIEHFDEDYAAQLFYENAVTDNCLSYYQKALNQIGDIRSYNKVTKKEALKTLKELPYEFWASFFALDDYMRDRRDIWNKKIELIKPAVLYLKTHRKKSNK